MILRIFATDGHTPEHLFRWSVEETAAHLCEQQVLWVTRLDSPWRPLVEWFVKQPCCRGVCLDPANLWDWYTEHEVTWRLAQALYYPEKEKPEAVCWLHDDMAPPTGQGFKDDLKKWLASESTALESQCYQLWNDFNTVRLDAEGGARDAHYWLAKASPDLRWLYDNDRIAKEKDIFRPIGAVEPWMCPWPFRHAKNVDKDFREGVGFSRKGFCRRVFSTGNPRCRPYDPKLTWEEFSKEFID